MELPKEKHEPPKKAHHYAWEALGTKEQVDAFVALIPTSSLLDSPTIQTPHDNGLDESLMEVSYSSVQVDEQPVPASVINRRYWQQSEGVPFSRINVYSPAPSSNSNVCTVTSDGISSHSTGNAPAGGIVRPVAVRKLSSTILRMFGESASAVDPEPSTFAAEVKAFPMANQPVQRRRAPEPDAIEDLRRRDRKMERLSRIINHIGLRRSGRAEFTLMSPPLRCSRPRISMNPKLPSGASLLDHSEFEYEDIVDFYFLKRKRSS